MKEKKSGIVDSGLVQTCDMLHDTRFRGPCMIRALIYNFFRSYPTRSLFCYLVTFWNISLIVVPKFENSFKKLLADATYISNFLEKFSN